MQINIKTTQDIEKMRISCRLAAEVLDYIKPFVAPGISTLEIDRLCHVYMLEQQKTIPAPLNYAPDGCRPFPNSVCTSLNNVICHGIPNEKPLKNGDILNIDVTVIKDGYYGDSSRMYLVGEVSHSAKRLCKVAYECMCKGISKVRPGAHLGDVGYAIQQFAECSGYSVVQEFCGHGIGKKFHEAPQVLHYGRPGFGIELSAGMIFTIEPMINQGKRYLRVLDDGWTVVTKDRSLSAQWEHTVLVTDNSYEVLTVSAASPSLLL